MKLCTVIFVVLVAATAAIAVDHGHLINVLHPIEAHNLIEVQPSENNRQKRSFLLGAGALGAVGLGAGALGAVGLGAGLIGAKAGLIGGALAGSALHGRSYGGGWGRGYGYGGYGGGYGYGGYPYGGYGGYGYGGYRSYYPTSYVVSDPWC